MGAGEAGAGGPRDLRADRQLVVLGEGVESEGVGLQRAERGVDLLSGRVAEVGGGDAAELIKRK